MTTLPRSYNTYNEIKDLIVHIERVALGIRSEIYTPVDEDFKELSLELYGLAAQIKTFIRQKADIEGNHHDPAA